MEYVPEEDGGALHRWTVVGNTEADKRRACHEYTPSAQPGGAPFGLYSPGDVLRVRKSSSYMIRYDLQVGFRSVPITQGQQQAAPTDAAPVEAQGWDG